MVCYICPVAPRLQDCTACYCTEYSAIVTQSICGSKHRKVTVKIQPKGKCVCAQVCPLVGQGRAVEGGAIGGRVDDRSRCQGREIEIESDPDIKLEKGNNKKERGRKEEGEGHLCFLVWSGGKDREKEKWSEVSLCV